MAVRGIHSTIQPIRARPMKRTMLPEIRAKVLAISSAGISGCSDWTLMTMLPTIVDMTATVYTKVSLCLIKVDLDSVKIHTPIVISFEVAKAQ